MRGDPPRGIDELGQRGFAPLGRAIRDPSRLAARHRDRSGRDAAPLLGGRRGHHRWIRGGGVVAQRPRSGAGSWPNRLDRGQYRFEGRACQAALDEPELQNAIHGLVRWLPCKSASKSADEVALTCALHPQPGYPWRLDLEVRYRLDATGLTVSFRARNASSVPAPFGIGFHPYLTVGTAIDDAVLRVPAN